MKIVVACYGKRGCRSFWTFENFIFFDTEENKIVSGESVPNPGHRPGFLPNFLADRNAEVIIFGRNGRWCRRYF